MTSSDRAVLQVARTQGEFTSRDLHHLGTRPRLRSGLRDMARQNLIVATGYRTVGRTVLTLYREK